MKRAIIFPISFIFTFVSKNIFKVILTITAITCFYISHIPSIYNDGATTSTLLKSFKYNKTDYYIIEQNDNLSIKEFDKPVTVSGNKITYAELNDSYILLTMAFYAIIFMLITITIKGIVDDDDDVSWELRDCLMRSMSMFITCEIEDGKYYYMAFGRLINISDRLVDKSYHSNICYSFGIVYPLDFFNYPKFKTKRENRNFKLDKIL